MKPSPNLFIALTAVVLVAGLGSAYYEYQSVHSTEESVERLRSDALDEAKLDNELKSLVTKLAKSSDQLNHLEQGVPQLAYVPTMLKDLEHVGQINGLEVLGVRPAVKPAGKDAASEKKGKHAEYSDLDIEVTCRGNYRAVKNFVKALQSFPKIVAARTISMTPKQVNSTQAGSPKLDVTFQLRSYLFPPDTRMLRMKIDEPIVNRA